ncbi:unnamed protein product [Sphagnum tenellum]
MCYGPIVAVWKALVSACRIHNDVEMGERIVNLPPGIVLHILKNLHVCGDCHTSIKFIAKIVGRLIVVRGANRFHHFEDSICSCRDYW